MLVRSDPFRQFDRLAEQALGTLARPAAMPMDAWRSGNEFVVEFDLPGIDPASIDLDVDRNVLTVRAERKGSTGSDVELVASERPRGVFSRQVILGDTLDTESISATYTSGVLRLTIPVAEKAKPRKIAISTEGQAAIGDREGSNGSAISATARESEDEGA